MTEGYEVKTGTLHGDFTNKNSEYSSEKIHPFTIALGVIVFVGIIVVITLLTIVQKNKK